LKANKTGQRTGAIRVLRTTPSPARGDIFVATHPQNYSSSSGAAYSDVAPLELEFVLMRISINMARRRRFLARDKSVFHLCSSVAKISRAWNRPQQEMPTA
jgi:hypothetical protein